MSRPNGRIFLSRRPAADSNIVRKAYIGAALACIVLLGAGATALYQHWRLLQIAHKAVDQDFAIGAWSSRAAVAALECRRYEKDIFLNLNDPPTRGDYLGKWNKAWQTLHDDLEQLETASRPGQDKLNVAKCLASSKKYRQHVQNVVAQIEEGRITRPADANRAITPSKEEFRGVANNAIAMASDALAQANRSGSLLQGSILWNIIITSVLAVLPSGLILVWTVCLTREIAGRNGKLRRREERLDNIINNASEVIYTLSPEGIVTFTSPAWTDKLGWAVDDIQGKSFAPFVHPDDVAACRSAMARLLATGTPGRGVEYRILHRNGTWRWHQSNVSLVAGSGGKPPHIVGIAEDITDRKLASDRQARLLKRLEGVNRLHEALILPGAVGDKFKKITETAVALLDLDFCRIWSVLPGDLCDSGCIHAASPDEAHRCPRRDRCLHLVASSGRYTQIDGDHRRVPLGLYKIGRVASGEEKKFITNHVTTDLHVHNHEWAEGLGLVSFAGYKLHDARGNTMGVLAMFAKHPLREEDNAFLSNLAETASRVIMDHAAQEELRQAHKLEGVGQLAGGVAHEFNNLLQVIDGYTCTGMDGLDREEERYKDFVQVRKAAERATALTRQLLGFSRRRAIELKSTDANQVLRDLVKLVRPTIGEHIALDLALAENAGTVYGDAGELEQALLNLCINARDAMPGGGKLLLKTETTVLTAPCWDPQFDIKPGRYVVFSVSDTGCGIPRDVQQHIFEPFYTTKEVGKGTGLGLAMVYGVVRQHKGAIHLYSELGAGTTFKLYLPPGDGNAVEDRREEATPALHGRETILLAEDDPAVRKLSVRTLENAGYTVLAAADGEEAVRIFEEHRHTIALAVLDAVMPRLTGHEVHRRIREISPDVKVICCTGYDRETARSNCLSRESVPLVQKPFTAQTLLAKVRETLDTHEACPSLVQIAN